MKSQTVALEKSIVFHSMCDIFIIIILYFYFKITRDLLEN